MTTDPLPLKDKYYNFRRSFKEWTNTKWGTVIWKLVRPLLALAIYMPTIWVSGPLKIALTAIWILGSLPDWIPAYTRMWWYFSKIIGFGKFKAGYLVCPRKELGEGVKTVLYSTEMKSINDYLWFWATQDVPKAAMIPTLEQNDILLVLEEEVIKKNPFWIEFDPYLGKGGRVKVLYNGKTYWANPKHLRQIKKPPRKSK